MAHSRFTAGDAVDQERAHEAPSQTGAETYRIVDLCRRGYTVVDQPQGLAPQRLHQPIGDEAVDLLAEDQRMHADAAVHLGGVVLGLLRRSRAAAHLDQRHQVHRVERVPDHQPFRVQHVALHLRG